MEDTRGFFGEGYEDAVRGNRIPDDTYHLVITGNLGEAPFSKPERPAVQLETEVASGEYVGRRGPRVTLQLGAHSYTSKSGKAIIVTAEEEVKNLMADVRAIHGIPAPTIPTGLDDTETLDAVADALVGDEFIAKVTTNKNDFQNAGYYRALDDPPKGFTLAKDLEEFRV